MHPAAAAGMTLFCLRIFITSQETMQLLATSSPHYHKLHTGGGIVSPRKHVISRVIAAADLDSALEPGLPIIELAGSDRVLIENHLSVIGYTSEYVCVRVRFGSVCVNGSGLMIAKMSKEQLVICGEVDSVQLTKGGSGK